MNSTIPMGNILTGSIDVISQSLTLPVIVILIVIAIMTIVITGMVISEYSLRKKVPVELTSRMIYEINEADSLEDVNKIVTSSDIPDTQKDVLSQLVKSNNLTSVSREALARRLVENEEERIDNTLRKTDVITRVGPTLGLMGTLIPMGPGLAALGMGDITTLAQSLTVAFDTTIVGIGSGALCYFLSKIRRGWYEHYLSDLDALTDVVLDKMREYDG
ncbi:MAG: flagellar motor protein MotA [Methanosphaera sp. rholeuAM74]|nr:MAG: flagellar motor protein MotA [Methanosphaera sp. rholeuAM74]